MFVFSASCLILFNWRISFFLVYSIYGFRSCVLLLQSYRISPCGIAEYFWRRWTSLHVELYYIAHDCIQSTLHMLLILKANKKCVCELCMWFILEKSNKLPGISLFYTFFMCDRSLVWIHEINFFSGSLLFLTFVCNLMIQWFWNLLGWLILVIVIMVLTRHWHLTWYSL